MERIISDEILSWPWYLPTGVRTAIRLAGSPARATDERPHPLSLHRPQPPSSYTSIELRMPQPQTVIELLAEDGRALGRATIRYSTGGASARPGPTLCSFRTGRRRRRRSRREPRRGGDTRRRSRAPGDARGAHGAAARDGGTRTPPLSATCSLRGCCSSAAGTAGRIPKRIRRAGHGGHVVASGGARRRERASALPALARPPARARVVMPVLANQSDPRDFGTEPGYAGAQEDARDEEVLAARRACEEASAARPRDPTRELEAHEAYQQILARNQKERETRAALEGGSASEHSIRTRSSCTHALIIRKR